MTRDRMLAISIATCGAPRELLLNHSTTSVTGGYSHGYPLKLKGEMLTEWADHIAGLVQPEGATLLR